MLNIDQIESESKFGLLELGALGGFDISESLRKIHRSKRLLAKNNEEYVDPEERARLVTKPDSVSITKNTLRKKQRTPQIQP